MLNNYFPEIFVINLDRRTDRMVQFISQAQRVNIEYSRRVSAIDVCDIEFKNPLNIDHFNPGDVACALSHKKVTELAKEMNFPYYLVLEDDVLFRDNFNELFEKYWKEVPEYWDMVYFGANHNGTNPPKVSENIVKVNGSFTTHAMVIKATMYDDLIRIWTDPQKQVDVLLSELHSKYNCYCFAPNLAGQRAGKSDILNRDVNYDFLLKDI